MAPQHASHGGARSPWLKPARLWPLSVETITQSALIAALYAGLTLLFLPISFGQVQMRVSEALTVLPVLFPSAIPGLFVGCLLANLLGGSPWQDVLFGSLATLTAAVLTRLLRKHLWLAALMPVVINALVVGLLLNWMYQLPLCF